MAWNRKREFSVVGVAIVSIVVIMTLSMSPASADDACDLTLRAAVNGGVMSGTLELAAVAGSDGLWTYSVTAPAGYSLAWFDGAFPVTTDDDAAQIGGGMITREGLLTGEFVELSACFRLKDPLTAQLVVRETRLGIVLL